jgi:DNA repair photolyase
MGCAHRCTFCYVRSFEARAERPSGAAYGASIRVKTNVAQVLAAELSRPGWRRELVAVGTATDPYQPAEGRYRLTRACLAVLARARTPASLVTRSPMVVRDIDVLQELDRAAGVSVAFSIPTLDERLWKATEPDTPSPTQRLRALERLRAAGLDAGVALAPLLPGLSDAPSSIASVLRAAKEAGASFVWASPLRLPPGTRPYFLSQLAGEWPALASIYEHRYRGANLPRAQAEAIVRRAAALAAEFGLSCDRPSRARPEAVQLPLWEG